jgi:nucleoside-diphosphate kinase
MFMEKQESEQTLVLIKPDALKNSLTGYVLSLLSEVHTNLRFAGLKVVHVSSMLAAEHYAEHRGKVFYPALIEYISGLLHYPGEPWKHRVIAIVYQGPDAVRNIRSIAGPTNPHQAREENPGCIRSMGTVVPLKDAGGNIIGERMDNLIHASATVEEAEREIKLWFKPSDIPPLMHAYATEVSDDFYYYKGGKLSLTHEPGSLCFLPQGDVAWKSDLETLRIISQGRPSTSSLATVVAKYLINLS